MKYLYDTTAVWGIPGGGVGNEETLKDTLVRELDEELGIKIEIGDLVCLAETPQAGKVKHTIHCIFAGKVAEGNPMVNPEQTSALGVEWVGIDELDDIVLYPPVNDVVKQVLTGDIRARYLGLRERTWF